MTSDKDYGKDAVSIKEEKEKIDIKKEIEILNKAQYEVKGEMKDYVKDKLDNNKFNIIFSKSEAVIYANSYEKISIITNDSIVIELTQISMTEFNIDKAYLAGKIGDNYRIKKIHQWDELVVELEQKSPFVEWFENLN